MVKDRVVINVAFLSTYPPRVCGIATFTEDLVSEIDKIAPLYNPFVNTNVIAISDDFYLYDEKVIKELKQFEEESYFEVAQFINESDIDLLVIQHEYGIYGGEYGEYLLHLVDNTKKPFIFVLHTVLLNPIDKQKYIVSYIGSKAVKVVTMARNTIELLVNIYNIPEEKILHIPHGVPINTKVDREKLKRELGLEGRFVVSTFGLIGPGKGIEYAIEAIAKVKDKIPSIIYLILGRTHPGVIKHSGESYRDKLMNMVKEYNLEDHVMFVNRYLTLDEILKYLQLSDIYVTPYLSKEQAVSGTLSYALASGKVIISTAYRYAEELLSDGRGILVDFRDSNAIAEAIKEVYYNRDLREGIEKKAFEYGKSMWWNVVAEKYIKLFDEVVNKKIETFSGRRWKKWNLFAPEMNIYSD
uniref:Glycosyltransferase n=1 Tax=Dictyoglomus thermophilum TaxID=14 RepID=A0A7C3MHV3_DICTH